MASSGSVDFSVSRDDIVSLALQGVNVMGAADTTTAAPFTTHQGYCNSMLNMLVKQWSGSPDFAPGIKMWSRKRAYLFLQTGTAAYNLGPTTTETDDNSKWASSYVETTISADEASGQTVISLTSITGISDTDYIGIELDSGAIHWSTVNGSPAGGTATITTAISGAAAAGNAVYAYATTAQGRRPLEIVSAVLRDNASPPNDIPMTPMLLEEYEAITNKGQDGDPRRYYYEATLTDGTIYLDYEPDDVDHVVRIVYLSPIEDFDAATDTPDYDQNWYLALVEGLKVLICGRFGQGHRLQEFRTNRDEALAIARNAHPENTRLYYQPEAPL